MRTRMMILASLLLAPLAMAQPGGDRPCGPEGEGDRQPPHELIFENADELGIDQPTLDAMADIFEANRPEMEALHEAIRDADEADRQALIEELHELGRGTMDEAMALLSPEQQDAVKELLPPPPGGPDGGPPGERAPGR
jgi:hypothetical protein